MLGIRPNKVYTRDDFSWLYTKYGNCTIQSELGCLGELFLYICSLILHMSNTFTDFTNVYILHIWYEKVNEKKLSK